MRKLQPILLILLMLLVVPLIPIAGAVEYPVLTEHVTDNAGIINAEYRQKIGDLLVRIEEHTTAEVAILTIKSLEGEDKAEYATEVGQRSGIGKKDVDNGLLLLIAMDDGNGKGAYFVATGYGLEGTLPDTTVSRINNEVLLPYLKKGKETGDISYYGQGIYEEMLTFEGLLTNNTEIVSKYGSSNSDSIGGSAIILIVIIFFAVIILIAIFIGNGGGGGSSGSGGYSSRGWSSSSSGGSSGSSSGGGFGGGSFGGGGSGGGFRRATGTVASNRSSGIRSSGIKPSSGFKSHRGGFGGGGFGGGGHGGGF